MKTCYFIILALIFFLFSCHPQQKSEDLQAPLFDNLGNHSLTITTSSELAQRLFDQGLNLAYGFNHSEAARAFREAARQDTTCAMCYWGVAYVLGPNYNAGMEDENKAEAVASIKKAQQHTAPVSEWEKALVDAMAARYHYEKTEERPVLDQDYANTMRKVYIQYPDNDDIGTLFAESLMDTHPWDLYTQDRQPKAWTPEIVATLEAILARSPRHPGANHMLIHAVEASSNPGQGTKSADRLTTLVPGSGHLVHMPSHIYIRTGRYHEGSVINEKAILADSIYIANCNAQGVYPLLYFPHNIHFLAACAALEGRGEVATNAAFEVAAHVDTSLIREPGYEAALQHYLIIPYYLMAKFGQWDKILTLPAPDDDLLYPTAIWHYVRGMAYAGKNNMKNATRELDSLKEIYKNPILGEMSIWGLNTVDHLVGIAELMLEAALLRKQEEYDQAIQLLKEAVAIEDGLIYNEPPDWFFSVRHSLGAALLQAGKYQEAEKIYKEDLENYPENGWALKGLYLSLANQNKTREATQVKEKLDKAWQHADIELASSEVKPMAYQHIQINPVLDRFLAGRTNLPVCGLQTGRQ